MIMKNPFDYAAPCPPAPVPAGRQAPAPLAGRGFGLSFRARWLGRGGASGVILPGQRCLGLLAGWGGGWRARGGWEEEGEEDGEAGESGRPPERLVESGDQVPVVRGDGAGQDDREDGGAERAADLLHHPGDHA